jgi:hypothetical protein
MKGDSTEFLHPREVDREIFRCDGQEEELGMYTEYSSLFEHRNARMINVPTNE